MSAPLLVIGDALLDIDLTGSAHRLAPDAPVPVLDDLDEVARPGGAALAAALAAESDREVLLLTALPDDDAARQLRDLLHEAGVEVCALPQAGATAVKRRVRAGGQNLLRLDSGTSGTISPLSDEAHRWIAQAGGVLVADYGRGVLDAPGVCAALGERVASVPVVWDPHPRGSRPVPGVRLATPNRDEALRATAAAGAPADEGRPDLAAISWQAGRLVELWGARAVAITLGHRGALISQGESSPSVIPAPPAPNGDTCGAGDRFAATAALALTAGALTIEAVQEAVLRASDFVARGGAAGWSGGPSPGSAGAQDVVAHTRSCGGTVVATGGCFDLIHAGHVATLEAARALGDCLVVCLNSDDSVRRLKGPGRPLVPVADRARVLQALAPVDAVVVFDEDTPEDALRRLRPHVWAKGGDYAGADLPEAALLREWGGVSVVLPYLDGRSTTRLAAAAARG